MSYCGTVSLLQVLPKDDFELGNWNSYEQPEPTIAPQPHAQGCAGGNEPGDVLLARNVMLQVLDQSYILESRAETQAFLRLRPGAITLLAEASSHLDEIFGVAGIRTIRLVSDDSERLSVFGIVLWSDSADSGREALARFDERWWLRNCNRADGVVNFNIELV